jgi:hypothetical protein
MSSPSNRASQQAQAAEQARLAAITNTQNRINQVFNDPARQAEIQQFVAGIRDLKMGDLNEQKANADRELKFALARGGQVGGSTQRDQQFELGKGYQKGVLDVDQQALGAGAQLQAADQDARGRLISLATTGLDATTGAQQAAAAMRSSIEAGRSAATAQGVGNFFGSVSDFAKSMREGAERRRANRDAGFGLYQPVQGFGGGGG